MWFKSEDLSQVDSVSSRLEDVVIINGEAQSLCVHLIKRLLEKSNTSLPIFEQLPLIIIEAVKLMESIQHQTNEEKKNLCVEVVRQAIKRLDTQNQYVVDDILIMALPSIIDQFIYLDKQYPGVIKTRASSCINCLMRYIKKFRN